MELKRKSQAPSATSTTLTPRLQRQVQPSQSTRAGTLQRAVSAFTSTPTTAQRQATQPVFQASALQRQEETHLSAQREPLQRQAQELSAGLPANAVQTALQRQANQSVPIQAPSRPQSSGDWVTVMRVHAQDMTARNTTTGLNSREVQQLTTLQRQTAHALAQGVKTSAAPVIQRHAEFAQHAVTLQRHPLTSAIPRAALNLVTPGERPALQRAVDAALHADALQRQQDEQALQLHSLQRQLAELDEQATQPVMRRIQERRGGGNPLPAAVQRHLEQGLNHDLSSVRIHDDPEADKMAKSVNAIAFTTGKDIFFQSGKFNPNTQSGLELLAHEVTHTVQQSQGKVGKGIDPDSGLENEAREMGRKLALKPQVKAKSHRKAFPTRASFTPTTTFQRRPAQSPMKPPANLTVGKIGVIKHTDGANLRSQPNPKGSLIQPTPLPPGTKVGVLSQTADGWSKVSLSNGKTGFVQTVRVTTDLPDPGSTLIKVPPGSTAIGIAERYYKAVIKPGQDLRFYVNVLEFVNKQRGTGAFQNDKALKGGNLLWIPSPTYAQTLVGTVKSGSITGGALAKTNALMGNSPGANIMRSVLESPTHIKEVLGDAWKVIEKHWPAMLATTLAFIGAELLVIVLAAMPEPTTITKFAAVGLQGLITAAAGAGAVMAGAAALKSAEMWLRTAWTAGGNASKIKAASKAFLKMIGNIAMAVASAAGAKVSAGKTGQLAGLYTKEQLIAQIGNKATYETLMTTLKARGVEKNNAQLLGALLKKVPDPLELKGFLRKVDKPTEFLATLEKYPLNRVRAILYEIDPQSIPPQQASKLLKLSLENPVPKVPLTATRKETLKAIYGESYVDKTYQGQSPVLRDELSQKALAQDAAAGKQYKALLDEILAQTDYVYRYTTRFAFNQLREKGGGIRSAFMTNALVKNPNAVSHGAQLKPEWYRFSQGNPDVVIKIPRDMLSAAEVPRPTGNTPELAGWELTTAAYPEAGKGGMLQFMGSLTNEALEKGIASGTIQVIDLKGGTSRLPGK